MYDAFGVRIKVKVLGSIYLFLNNHFITWMKSSQKESKSKNEEVLGEFFFGSEKKNNNSLGRMIIAPMLFIGSLVALSLRKHRSLCNLDPLSWPSWPKKKSRLRQVLQGETKGSWNIMLFYEKLTIGTKIRSGNMVCLKKSTWFFLRNLGKPCLAKITWAYLPPMEPCFLKNLNHFALDNHVFLGNLGPFV